jgi:hypothetical protein
MRSIQTPGSLTPIIGWLIVAITIVAAEIAVSASVTAGQRRQATASPSARNGRIGMRKRGPGEPPPSGSQ